MAGIEITDPRIIKVMASSTRVTQQLQPLLQKLRNVTPVDIQNLLTQLNPPQQTNYHTLYIRVLEFWRSRVGTTGARAATPYSLSSILRESMDLPSLAGQIETEVYPTFQNNQESNWWVDAAKLLAQNEEAASDRWIELATFMGIKADVPGLRMVKDANLRTFWLKVLTLFHNVNELHFNKVTELQRALREVGLMHESNQIGDMLQMASREEVDGQMDAEMQSYR